MVKSQAIDIAEVILSRIRRPHVVHTLCRPRKSRCELLSTSEAHWFTTKSDGMWFLTGLRAYGAVASRLGPCEMLLPYGKLATSSITEEDGELAPFGVWGRGGGKGQCHLGQGSLLGRRLGCLHVGEWRRGWRERSPTPPHQHATILILSDLLRVAEFIP